MNRRTNNEIFPFNADGYAKVEDMLAEDNEYITLMKELFRKRFRTSSQYKNFVEDMTRAITHSLFLKKFAEGKRKVYERKYGELNYAKSQNDMELYTKISKLLYQTFDEFLETFKKVFVDMDFTYPRVLISAIKKKFYKSKIAKSKLVDNYSVFFFILCIFESSDRTDDADYAKQCADSMYKIINKNKRAVDLNELKKMIENNSDFEPRISCLSKLAYFISCIYYAKEIDECDKYEVFSRFGVYIMLVNMMLMKYKMTKKSKFKNKAKNRFKNYRQNYGKSIKSEEVSENINQLSKYTNKMLKDYSPKNFLSQVIKSNITRNSTAEYFKTIVELLDKLIDTSDIKYPEYLKAVIRSMSDMASGIPISDRLKGIAVPDEDELFEDILKLKEAKNQDAEHIIAYLDIVTQLGKYQETEMQSPHDIAVGHMRAYWSKAILEYIENETGIHLAGRTLNNAIVNNTNIYIEILLAEKNIKPSTLDRYEMLQKNVLKRIDEYINEHYYGFDDNKNCRSFLKYIDCIDLEIRKFPLVCFEKYFSSTPAAKAEANERLFFEIVDDTIGKMLF